MKKLIIFLTIFLILACFCLALVPVQAEQEPLWSFKTGGEVHSVAISSDGNYIAAGASDGNVYIIDKQGKKIGSYKTKRAQYGEGVWSVAISSDGNYIAAGARDGTAYIIDKQGKEIGSYKKQICGGVYSVAITPDGNYIAAGSGDNNVYIIDKQGKKIGSFKTGGEVHSVAISSDGNYIAAGSLDDNVYIIDKQGKKIGSYETGGNVWSVAITSDGNYIAAGGRDKNVYIIDKQGKKIGSFKTGALVNSVAISSDGNYIAAGSHDWNVYIIDKQGKKIGSYKTGWEVHSVAISSDGNYIAAGSDYPDSTVYILDKQGKEIGSYETGGEVRSVAITPDGNYIAAGGRDDNVYLFAKGTTNTGTAKVYVKNEDDDDLYIKLYIEHDLCPQYKESKNVPSGSSNYPFGDYELSPGDYKFKIEWKDPDTNEWYEDETPVYIRIRAGESKTVTLTATKHLPSTGTAKVCVNNEDDDDLDVKLWIGEEHKETKNVPSGSSNYHFGDYELSPGDYKFKIKWNDPDTDQEYESMPVTATISTGKATTVTLTATKHLTSTGTAKVYVNNEDDDNLDISLYIDDKITDTKIVFSGSSNYHFGDYELSPGDYKYKIEWNDPDTYEWYEYESTATISVGEPTTVTLTVEKHVTVKAVANIINYDDDELEIDLYMDDEYITTKTIPHWGQQVEYITVLPGTYTFKIVWEDPDTWKKYEIENTVTFEPGDIGGRKVNLRVPKHQATTADVYVMNKYSDTLEIDLEIDGKFEDRKEISPSSSMRFYGSYEVSPDSPIFEMSWDDPDTGEACRLNKEETFDEEEVKEIRLIAEKHGPALEVDVKPYGCVLEEGDKKNIDITIKNTGDSTAESVSGIIESKNRFTAIIGGSKTPYIGDIKPGETWTETFAVPYIEAKKEGETTIEVKVRSNNAGDVLKDIQVRVVKPEVLPPGFIPRIEPLPDKLIDEDLKKSSPHTNDFTEMFDDAEEEITDIFLSNGLDAALIVQSSSKAGKAVNGKDVMAFLAIANKKNTPLYVVAKIVPPYQDVFKYYDGKYLIRVQKKLTPMSPVDNEALDYLTIKSNKFSDTFKTVGNWEWQNYKEQIQFYDAGTVFYIEPNHILTIASRMTPQQTGWFDISGEVYYAEQDPESYLKLWKDIVWTPGKNAVKFDLDEMEHVTLAKSIYVEEKKWSLWGWLCP